MPSFNNFYEQLVDAGIDWVADDIKAALLTTAWTPDRTADFYDDLTNELANGDGYLTEGEALTTKAVATAANVVYLEADDIVWTFTASKSFRYVVFYKDTGVAGTSPLIWYVDLGALTLSGTYTIQLNALGLISFSDA